MITVGQHEVLAATKEEVLGGKIRINGVHFTKLNNPILSPGMRFLSLNLSEKPPVRQNSFSFS